MIDAMVGWTIPETLCLHVGALPQVEVTVPQWVYFIQAGGPSGPVKIGTTGDLKKRLAGLQTSAPEDLILLDVIPGGREKEAALHAQFQHLRMRGEWFVPGSEIFAFLRQRRAEARVLLADGVRFLLKYEMTLTVWVSGEPALHHQDCPFTTEHPVCAKKCRQGRSIVERAEALG